MPEPDLFALLEQGDAAALHTALAAQPDRAAARDPAGISLLMTALYRRQADLAAEIATHLPSLDAFEAAALGRVDRLAALPDAAAGVAPDGFTPLHLAAFFDRVDALRHLLDHGADPNARADNASRVTPLHSAAAARSVAGCALLLERGADPDARQAGGWTALHAACLHRLPELARVVLEAGADPDVAADDGRTADAMLPPEEDRSAYGLGTPA